MKIFGEPALNLGGCFEGTGVGQDGCCACGFDEMEGVDDAYAAAFVEAEDGLGVLEVWVHPCGGIDEPGVEMEAGVGGVFFVAGEEPCSRESWDDETEAHHGLAVVVEVLGIGEAVATDVRAVGVFGVGPPVVTLGVEVVRAAWAARTSGGGYGDGLFGEIVAGCAEDAFVVLFGHESPGGDCGSGLGRSHG